MDHHTKVQQFIVHFECPFRGHSFDLRMWHARATLDRLPRPPFYDVVSKFEHVLTPECVSVCLWSCSFQLVRTKTRRNVAINKLLSDCELRDKDITCNAKCAHFALNRNDTFAIRQAILRLLCSSKKRKKK